MTYARNHKGITLVMMAIMLELVTIYMLASLAISIFPTCILQKINFKWLLMLQHLLVRRTW